MLIALLAHACLAVTPDAIELSEPICIDSTGSRWRRPVHTDVLEHAIVNGEWNMPVIGDTLERPDGRTLSWRPLREQESRGPRGGYVLYTFDSDEAFPAMLADMGVRAVMFGQGEQAALAKTLAGTPAGLVIE